MNKNKLKNAIRKITPLAIGAKLFYDWNSERKFHNKITEFIKKRELPNKETAPELCAEVNWMAMTL